MGAAVTVVTSEHWLCHGLCCYANTLPHSFKSVVEFMIMILLISMTCAALHVTVGLEDMYDRVA